MPIFNLKNKKLERIKERKFKLEKEIQTLTENSLFAILGLEIVKSEFSLKKFRIDTLAFDRETKSFVIIEYKRDKNFSVIDQGYAYLSLMLNNKSDFVLEYNENKFTKLRRDGIDWSQSRVIFISPSFTIYQREAINFKDLPIELWEIKRYENNTVNYSKIQTSGSQETVKTISRENKEALTVNEEIKVYTEEESLCKATEEIKELYKKVKSSILDMEDLKIKPKKLYIAFISNSNVADIHIQKNALKIWLNLKKGDLEDPKTLFRDVSNTGHWGNGEYETQIKDDSNLEYLMSLVKQSINKHKEGI